MKYSMKDNFAYVKGSMRGYTLSSLQVKDVNRVKRFFSRFLKERGLLKQYKKNYNDIEIGIEYRKYLNQTGNKTERNQDLGDFLTDCKCKLFFIDAFLWVDSSFWSNISEEWIDYIKKQEKLGLI